MDNYYNKDSIVNIYAYPPYHFEETAAAQVAVNTALLIKVSIMLCGIAHMEGWHDHHSIFEKFGRGVEDYVNEYTPQGCNGVKPQSNEPSFLYSVLRNKDIVTSSSFYRPGDGINIYQDGSNSEWLEQFDTELKKRYIICSVTLDKTSDNSKIQQCFTENDINEDIFICRDVAYGNVAYDIRRWGPDSKNPKVTKVYNVQTASGVYDPGPSVSYYSDAGIKCGYQDIAGEEGVPTASSTDIPTSAKGNSRYCLFDDSKSKEQITTYPAFGQSKMESPEEMMYSKFNSQLFGENLASYYANERQLINKKDAQSIIDSSQVNLVVEYEENKLYIVNKHSSNKATSMLDLPFICSCLKYSAAVDAIDIASKTYEFDKYTIINQSGPLKIMTKKFGDSGIALQTLRNRFSYFLFEPNDDPDTKNEYPVTITSEKSNGIHAFLSYDQVAIGAALEYGCPVVMYNVNQTLTGTHGGVLLFISRKIKEEFSNPNKIRTELNSKIATVANTDLLNDTGGYVQGKLDEVNNPIKRIGSTLTEYMNRMELIVDQLTEWSSSKESAQYDIWYQNYLRLASIITKHASQVSSVMKLITNLRTNYPNIIRIGKSAVDIYIDTTGPINQYATTDDAVAAAVANAANIIVTNLTNLTNLTNNADLNTEVAAAVTAANISGDNINLKKSNVVLKVILDKINAAIQLGPQINKITEKLTLIERTLTSEVGAIENVQNEDPPVVIKSFRKNVKFTNDIILNRCNPYSGLGNARRMRAVRTFFNNPNGLDPSVVELGLVIIKQCFDDLYGNSVTLNDINGNSVTFENYFTQQIQSLFGDFYRVANTKGLKPTYRLSLTGIPDDYQDRFMNVDLRGRYDGNPEIFGGKRQNTGESLLTGSNTTDSSTKSFESTKSSKSSKSPTVLTVPTKSSEPIVLTVPTESTENDKKRSENLLSELIEKIENMKIETQGKMKRAEEGKVSIIKKMKTYSYAELPDDIIAKSEKIDSIVDGFNALIELLEMIKEFINKKGTNYIKHSDKPESYEFLQARMQLYQVFFVISFLQTLNQYQQSNPNKPQISNSNKSGGAETSQTQTGGIRESAINSRLKSNFDERGQIGHSLNSSSNIIMSFDIKSKKITKKKRVNDNDFKEHSIFILTQKIENFSRIVINAEFILEKKEELWSLYFNKNFIFHPPDLPLDNDNKAVDFFNNTYILFMGYVITITEYQALLNIVRPDVVDTKSNLLINNDLSEANNLSPVVQYYDDNDDVDEIPVDIINFSLDDGGNIMDTIFGEENSEKYDYSLAGNGELYQYFARLANTTSSFFDENNFYFEEPLINREDADEMIGSLLSFLGEQSNVSIVTGGGKPKKTKKTKKKRKQKKHTKKLKYRKKSTKSTRKTEKKRK